jgi:hypothetical protein
VITVETRVTGSRRAPTPSWQIPFSGDGLDRGSPVTLRDLITLVVRDEVAGFRERQVERRFLAVLTENQIADGASRGRVAPGGQELDQRVDLDEAVGAVLQAFEDGIYYVFVDTRQRTQLDEQVELGDESTVTFLRLTPLAGG